MTKMLLEVFFIGAGVGVIVGAVVGAYRALRSQKPRVPMQWR